VRYCGVVPMRGLLQLAMLEEVRVPEPPVQLSAIFFEPGSAVQVAAELQALDDVVLGYGAPVSEPADPGGARTCDALLRERGVALQPPDSEMRRLAELLGGIGRFTSGDPAASEGPVPEGAYSDFPAFETNADGVFCALQGRRLPARRHPLGMQLRIEELEGDHVVDDGGELWHRRIEELDAAGAALCAHRYAVGHASWVGSPEEGVVVLPGAALPDRFTSVGVMPTVERLQLPPER
jgi:predicted nuclease with RNAse H fold